MDSRNFSNRKPAGSHLQGGMLGNPKLVALGATTRNMTNQGLEQNPNLQASGKSFAAIHRESNVNR